MESVHGVWTVGRFIESSQGCSVCLYSVNMSVLCNAACNISDLIRTRCLTNAPNATFGHVRGCMLYLNKFLYHSPPRSVGINRVGI